MSSTGESSRPPSLAQHFDAPEDYIGHFGWLCGYSADAPFLDDAAERFTRLTHAQRAHQGRIAIAGLLDPCNPPISMMDAPGVAHLPIMDYATKPFRLLHAKVALLGFRHHEEPSQWRLRLLVSTGNWTRQSLEESLDLSWRLDIASESLSRPNVGLKQHCADIDVAWELLEWIQQFFDVRLLNAPAQGRASETMVAQQQVRQWINACSEKAEGSPRFFDNRKSSLLFQLPNKIKVGGKVKRNYLAMGSGFYEAADDPKRPPKVPVAILKTLREEGLLTAKPELDLYVNPAACQSIATSLQPLHDLGITVRPATAPAVVFGEGGRILHAKFLFSANRRDSSNACISPWVYLGSGNLTHPGFANKMSATAGNLEAGVVFTPSSLCWQKNKATPEHQVVTNLLPIQWVDAETGDDSALNAGPGMEQREAMYVAPPVTWLTWHESDSVSELRTDGSGIAAIELLDSAGIACLRTTAGFRWCEARPREVCIRWKADDQHREARIPVVDQYGRIAAAELPAIDIDEAWWQLADFPMPPVADDEGDAGDENEGKHCSQGRSVPVASYPIRQMMDLIESVAAKQTEINQLDWALWCNRLEQALGQAVDSVPVQYFRDELKLNPLSPLRHQPFRPLFAESSDSESGSLYDETLTRIELNWNVAELSPIEGSK
ncbi:MAG: hypothetical protein JKY26_13795 [Pseudomonas sp.]|nr:hypothetical protein [Pseudomonas sp.]